MSSSSGSHDEEEAAGAPVDAEADEASAEAMRAAYERRAAREAEVTYEGELPADIAGTPFAIFRATDIWDRLASHPDTRAHIADSGFRSAVEKLRRLDGQAAAREVMDDPRLLQAVMAMAGEGRLKLREEELAMAEVGGRMRRRDPVQFSHMERAHSHASCEEAKEAGNRHFKQGEHADAAACYERALLLVGSAGPGDGGGRRVVRVTLLSNRAAAMLKLRRAEEALRCCEEALRCCEKAAGAEEEAARAEVGAGAAEAGARVAEAGAEKGGGGGAGGGEAAAGGRDAAEGRGIVRASRVALPASVLSKVYFRMAQALEMKRRFGEAATAAERALAVAEGGGGAGGGGQGGAGCVSAQAVGGCDAGTVASLRRELARLRKLAQRAEAEAAESVKQREREAKAAALRGKGVPLTPEAACDTAGGSQALDTVEGVHAAGAAGPGAVHTGLIHSSGRGYLREVDYSHWAGRWLGERLRGLTHKRAGCTIVVEAMVEGQSEVGGGGWGSGSW
jgi:tetratricopeptide (TPR) repeat protein